MALLKRIFMNEWAIVGAILANSATLFLMGFDRFHSSRLMDGIDHFFTLFFIIEILVKVKEFGWKNYIANSGNKFDFILVAISTPSLFEIFLHIPDISYLLVFRLMRVFRILRFMRFIPNIHQLIAGVARAVRASIFVFAALFIYNILLAVLSSYLFRTTAPEYFGDPLISLYSIFQIFTLEGWNEIPLAIIKNAEPGSWTPGFARLFFAMVVLTGGIFGFSIVNAIFVDEMVMDNTNDLEDKVDLLNKKVDELLEKK